MKLKRAVEVQNHLVMCVRDAVSCGRICKMSHSEICERAASYVAKAPRGTPRHVREYVMGYYRAIVDALWLEVEFCYRDADGVVYSTHKDSARRRTEEFYARNEGHLLSGMECAHLWKGSDKEFTKWSKP